MTLPQLGGLYQTALRLVMDRRSAEAAVSEACARASKAFKVEMDEQEWRVELFRQLIGSIRRRASGVRRIAQPVSEGEPCGGAVARALTRLPLGYREPILLVDCQGFRYSEAGRILGLSVSGLTDLLSEARDLLHQQMAQGETGDVVMASAPDFFRLEASGPRGSVQSE